MQLLDDGDHSLAALRRRGMRPCKDNRRIAVPAADGSAQMKHCIFDIRQRGDRRMAVAVQRGDDRSLCFHGNARRGIIQSAKNRLRCLIAPAALQAPAPPWPGAGRSSSGDNGCMRV